MLDRKFVRTGTLATLDAAGWRLLNFAQACFLAFWTLLWVPVALLVLALTLSCDVPLAMARHVWAPPLLWAAGARLKVRGLKNLEGVGPCIFMSNHQSMIDIPVVFSVLPRNIRFVAKRVLLYVPVLGWYMWAMGMIFVDRSKRQQAIRSPKKAAALVRSGAHVMSFPEGTRSRDGRILPFKKGLFMLAIEAGVPIVPIAIEGARDVLPADGFRPRPGEIRVAIGEPIPTEGLSADDRDALIRRVRDRVIDLHREIGGKGGDKEHYTTGAARSPVFPSPAAIPCTASRNTASHGARSSRTEGSLAFWSTSTCR